MQEVNTNRTFGLELEFMDIKKAAVEMPSGYSWSPDEKWIINSDSSPGTPSAKYGGEINTRPLLFNENDLGELERFIGHCLNDCGGRPGWYQTFDIHVDISDLTLDQMKNLFFIGHVSAPYWYDITKMPKWSFGNPIWATTATIDWWHRVFSCESFSALKESLSNNSIKGFYRHTINLAPLWRIGTCEFRSFSSTKDLTCVRNSIAFCLSLVDIARSSTREHLASLDTKQKLLSECGIDDVFADWQDPFIFAANENDKTRYVAKQKPMTKRIISYLANEPDDHINIANTNLFSECLPISEHKSVTLYTKNPFYFLVNDIANNRASVEYRDRFVFINDLKNGQPNVELACLMLFYRMQRIGHSSLHGKRQFSSMERMAESTISNMIEWCDSVISFCSEMNVVDGTLLDAQSSGLPTIFQQASNPKIGGCLAALKKYTDFEVPIYSERFNYNEVDFNKPLYVFSPCGMLNMPKAATDGGFCLYSTVPADNSKTRTPDQVDHHLSYPDPPDDLVINDVDKLVIEGVAPSGFLTLQQKYIKKVDKVSGGTFSFVVTYDGYLLGGFCFKYPKNDRDYDLQLLSDFGANNNVPRLSKLILFCIGSNEIKQALQRKSGGSVDTTYTRCYTKHPVSMKYRGPMKKNKAKSKVGALVYELQFGSHGSLKDVMEKYIQSINKAKQ